MLILLTQAEKVEWIENKGQRSQPTQVFSKGVCV